ncbi:MAG: hypothetical protein HQL01_00330 [Nitrospirae bacterium]|nr:hypothetical protein [Nitrospirota bacterium]
MEKDFHYDIIYSIAKLTECKDAEIIAHASQFVDDNSERWFSDGGGDIPFPEKIECSTGGNYFPIMTQSMSPLSVDPYVQNFVYVPFHFLPGDNNVTIDKKKNPLSTTPNSNNAKTLLNYALESKEPYRIGIALHTYADTWSHQNFTGMREDWNSVYPWHNAKKYLVPDIGHAEAGHSPDVISEIWTDHRLGNDKQIDNKKRALDAVENIYKAMRDYTGAGPQWSTVAPNYTNIVNSSDFDNRVADVSDFIRAKCHEAVPQYVSDVWINGALERNGLTVKFKDGVNHLDTHWYKFNKAAKAQLALVLDLIKGL